MKPTILQVSVYMPKMTATLHSFQGCPTDRPENMSNIMTRYDKQATVTIIPSLLLRTAGQPHTISYQSPKFEKGDDILLDTFVTFVRASLVATRSNLLTPGFYSPANLKSANAQEVSFSLAQVTTGLRGLSASTTSRIFGSSCIAHAHILYRLIFAS